MGYSFNVYNPSTQKSQTMTGNNVNDLLQRVFREYYYRGPAFFRSASEQKRSEKEIKKELASQTTTQIQDKIREKDDILSSILMIDVDVWGYLLNEAKKDFTEPLPEKIPLPSEPELLHKPLKPDKQSPRYTVRRSVFSYLFPSKYNEALKDADEIFESDLAQWELELKHVENANSKLLTSYSEQIKKINADNELNLLEWNERKENYNLQKMSRIENQNTLRKEYENLDADAVEYYNKALLIQYSEKNDFYEKDYDLCYNSNNKVLTIDFLLPSSNDISDIKEVKYNATQDTFEEKAMNKSEFQKYYEDIIYKITLRTIYTVFKFNDDEVIDAVVFNGYIETIDKSTGQNIEPCILSVHAKRDIFEEINLSNVDPKSCFKNLKGISASNLAIHAAVAPILKIDKKDKRFIDQKGVISDLDSSLNLATMNWEDFEHLVSEIFEKEFSVNGGEVKVTRASRDGGVDAIAFDPDPIRGGKIVIQAKRYTNTVGVSAVRDLYGTVMNEGATKGILVTTADYGPDAYEFAKGKPLTLLNGTNLLHLLEKHGHNAKIDLREAKKSFMNM